jgi:hypothetical protein
VATFQSTGGEHLHRLLRSRQLRVAVAFERLRLVVTADAATAHGDAAGRPPWSQLGELALAAVCAEIGLDFGLDGQ